MKEIKLFSNTFYSWRKFSRKRIQSFPTKKSLMSWWPSTNALKPTHQRMTWSYSFRTNAFLSSGLRNRIISRATKTANKWLILWSNFAQKKDKNWTTSSRMLTKQSTKKFSHHRNELFAQNVDVKRKPDMITNEKIIKTWN